MQKKGFTLMEMLIVIIIISVMVVFATPAYKRAQARAKYQASLGTLVQLGAAVQMLERDSGKEWGDFSSIAEQYKPDWFSDSDLNTEAENIEKLSNISSSGVFKAALLAHNYIIPRFASGDAFEKNFEFYLCPEESSQKCCEVEDGEYAVVCMYLPDSEVKEANREYSWAGFMRDGSVKRKTGRTGS